MAPFPSPVERVVASALLLLATKPPRFCLDDDRESATKTERSKRESCRASFVSGDSDKSSGSLITTATEASTEEMIRARKIRLMALAALRRDINKLKVVRRSRSKTQTTWNLKAISGSSAATASFGSDQTTAESSASSARSRFRYVSRSAWNHNSNNSKLAKVREAEPMKRKSLLGSAHMRRRAEQILKLLSGGCCFSEIKIRQSIGDSPDTSKALRMLLKLGKVKRSGIGGRRNPYIYTIA